MPVIAPNPSLPYDSVNSVLNLARVRILDAIQSIGGEVLTDVQPFTQVYFNGGFRRFQEFLANFGYARFVKEVILFGCPVVQVSDPAIQTNVNWQFYFDGSNYNPTPVLPQDLISPLKMWERQTGGNYQFPIHPNMENTIDGLPAQPKQWRNGYWQWREDAIWMPGSQFSMDLRIEYAAYLGDFVNQGNPPSAGTYWYNLPVPIMRCLSPLAWYVAYEVSSARGDADAATFKANGEEEARLIFNRDVRMKQRVNIRRIGRSLRNNSNGGGWGGMCY